MRRLAVIAGLLAAFIVTGCASTISVSPLYTKTDAVADPSLVGTWITQKQDVAQAIVHIAPAKDSSYQVTVRDTESDDDAIYQAHLIRLSGESFADLILTDYRHAGQSVDLPWGAVALHEIVKYQVTRNDLAFSLIDDDALSKLAKQPDFPLRFRSTTEGAGTASVYTIILSSTGALRRYLASHPSAIFGNAEHLKRQP